jgi:hypothetical protein
MDRRPSNLKYLLLMCINFGGKIGDFINISHLNMDLIHLWNCGFETEDTIWSALLDSMSPHHPLDTGKNQSFQFIIRTHDHTTQIVCRDDTSSLIPNSSDLVHKLILPLGENLPSELSLDDISSITFLPPEANSSKSLSSQSKKNVESINSSRCPKLEDLFLSGVSMDDVEKDFGPIQLLGLNVHAL